MESPFAKLRVRGLAFQVILALGLVMGIAQAVFPVMRKPSYATGYTMLAYAVMLSVVVVRGRMARLEWRRMLGPAPKLRDLPLAGAIVPLALITLAALVLIFVPLSYIAPDLVERTILGPQPLDSVTSPGQFVALFITIAVVAPIVEELVFRGLLLHRFAYKWGTSAGVVFSSALFALGHLEWIGHFLIGVALALIYLRTRSLWTSMVVHGVYNATFAVSIGWRYFTHQLEEATTLAEFRSGLPAGLIAFVAGVFLFWLYIDLYWKKDTIAEVISREVPYYAGTDRD